MRREREKKKNAGSGSKFATRDAALPERCHGNRGCHAPTPPPMFPSVEPLFSDGLRSVLLYGFGIVATERVVSRVFI